MRVESILFVQHGAAFSVLRLRLVRTCCAESRTLAFLKMMLSPGADPADGILVANEARFCGVFKAFALRHKSRRQAGVQRRQRDLGAAAAATQRGHKGEKCTQQKDSQQANCKQHGEASVGRCR